MLSIAKRMRCPEDRDYILQKLYVFFGRGDPSPTNLCSYRLSAKTVCNAGFFHHSVVTLPADALITAWRRLIYAVFAHYRQ